MAKEKFGIQEIAKEAGVSIATVSRVLNNSNKTSEAARKKVLDVVKKHKYFTRSGAKNLYPANSNSIAIFVYDMSNPFYIDLIDQLNLIALENKYTLIICNAGNNFEREAQYYEYCKSIHTSGIVFTAGTTRENFGKPDDDLDFSPPIVLLDREGFHDRACYKIKSDHRKGISMLVDYLYRLNHRKIAYVTAPTSILSAKERLDAYIASMENLGLPVPDDYISQGDYTVKSGTESFDYFYSLADPPTAIIAANDLNARGFIMRANSLGVKIPDEFSVCGFDGLHIESFYPTITSIKHDTVEMAKTMFEWITHAEENPPPQEKILDVSMITGMTCHKI